MTRPAPASDTRLPTLALLAVTAAWGSTFFLLKDVLDRLPATDFLAVRFAIATLAVFLIAPRAVARLSARERRHGLALGVVYGFGQLLQTIGLQTTAASVSGFVTGMYVVFTPLLAAVLLRARVTRTVWLAVGLATVGLGVLSLQGFSLSSGAALTLASAVLYAAHIVGLGQWSDGRNALGLTIVQLLTITVICSVGALPGGLELPANGADWGALLFMALVAGAGALMVQTWAQAHLPATRAAIVMTMEPVWAGLFAVLFGGESLGPRVLVGGALVLAAMYLVELGPTRDRTSIGEVTHVGPV